MSLPEKLESDPAVETDSPVVAAHEVVPGSEEPDPASDGPDLRYVAAGELSDTPADGVERDAPAADSEPFPMLSCTSFSGSLIPVATASQKEIIDGLVAVVAAEGPILGHRLHSVYVRAASGQKVGSQIARTLNSAVTAAVRKGPPGAGRPTS
jgi:hypothetical protein